MIIVADVRVLAKVGLEAGAMFGAIVCLTSEILPIDEDIDAIPAGLL